MFCVRVGDNGVRNAEPLDVGQQNFGAGRHKFVGNQQSLPTDCGGELGCFSAGRGADIEDKIAFFDHCHCRRDREHCSRLLQIERTGMVQRMVARADLRAVEIKAVFLIRNRAKRQIRQCGYDGFYVRFAGSRI